MGWTSPTGHNDPNNKWSSEINAYDDNTGTAATNSMFDYNNYLELTLSSGISCDKVRIRCSGGLQADAGIDVYYGDAWHNIFSGSITPNEWVEKTIGSTQIVDKARVKSSIFAGSSLYEFDFNEVGGAATFKPQVIMVI